MQVADRFFLKDLQEYAVECSCIRAHESRRRIAIWYTRPVIHIYWVRCLIHMVALMCFHRTLHVHACGLVSLLQPDEGQMAIAPIEFSSRC